MKKINRQGSLTVEAALILPIFIFAALSILYVNKMILYAEKVQWALARTGREVSAEYAATQNQAVVNQVYLMARMKQYVNDDRLQVSMLNSRFDEKTDEIDLVADYSLQIPFPVINSRRFYFTWRYHTRGFTGVDTRMEKGEDEECIVYITKTGKVYHKNLDCSYLKLSISQVKFGDIEYLRSEGGGKYYACEGCCGAMHFTEDHDVYICNYGNRFHCIRSCKKIKRSIQEIKLSQAGGRLPCSKCGKE